MSQQIMPDQSRRYSPLILADIGNTALKTAVFMPACEEDSGSGCIHGNLSSADKPLQNFSDKDNSDYGFVFRKTVYSSEGRGKYSEDDIASTLKEAAGFLQNVHNRDVAFVMACSSSRFAQDLFKRKCSEILQIDPYFLSGEKLENLNISGVRNSYSNPEKLGPDRIAALLGAMRLCRPESAHSGKSIAAACFGTANTITFLHGGSIYGGAIAPGLDACLNALHSSADRLDEKIVPVPDGLRSTSPAEAISCGLIAGAAAWLDGIVSVFEKTNECKVFTVACGGNADMILPWASRIDVSEKDLVFLGLIEAYSRLSSSCAPRRRQRYSGRYPRNFSDKYKEHSPEKYPDIIEKVVSKGGTAAGTHRPVMPEEVLAALKPERGDMGLDATLGYGGHASLILPLIQPEGRLWAIDVDGIELSRTIQRMRAKGFCEDVLYARRMNFAGIASLKPENPEGFDFVLADLGVSSMQLDDPSRGFSAKADGPLDLRLNRNKGMSAASLLAVKTEGELSEILFENSDEPHSDMIARAIKKSGTPLYSTGTLVKLIRSTLSGKGVCGSDIKKSVQRVFMALRIEVNEEFMVLERFLDSLPHCLKPYGRAVIISFHSGEDRRVKKSFRDLHRSSIYKDISPEPVRPSPEETRSNPRSSCAKLRWAVRAEK